MANDLRSAMVQADLLEVDPQTGEKLDYAAVARALDAIRASHGSALMAAASICSSDLPFVSGITFHTAGTFASLKVTDKEIFLDII